MSRTKLGCLLTEVAVVNSCRGLMLSEMLLNRHLLHSRNSRRKERSPPLGC